MNIFEIEPTLRPTLDSIIGRGGENKYLVYEECKEAMDTLVGFGARNRELRTCAAYKAAIQYVCNELGI